MEEDYYQVCKEDKFNYEELKGLAYIPEYNGKHIANIFSQKPNFDTDYEMMRKALNWVKIKAQDYKLSVAIPYGIRMWYCQWRLEQGISNNKRCI